MMKRASLLSAALGALLLAACGPAELVVTAEVEVRDPETGTQEPRPVSDLVVQLLPFDRDAIFDSLARAYDRPEPTLPPEIAIMRDSLFESRDEWSQAESEWLAVRDRLQNISREMRQFSPAEARYRELFFEFEDLETRLRQAEQRRDQAFNRYDRLQRDVLDELNQFRLIQEMWEDEAFADFGEVVRVRLSEAGREIMADTTDATGIARLRPRPGEWWVHSRYRLPTEELYWNIRVEVDRGDPVQLRLTRENAEIRQVF
jgi:hypothetical protein